MKTRVKHGFKKVLKELMLTKWTRRVLGRGSSQNQVKVKSRWAWIKSIMGCTEGGSMI